MLCSALPDYILGVVVVEVGASLSAVLKVAHPPPCRLANLQKLNCSLALFLGTISTRLPLHTTHSFYCIITPREQEEGNQNQNQTRPDQTIPYHTRSSSDRPDQKHTNTTPPTNSIIHSHV